jgi:hypothetical protein
MKIGYEENLRIKLARYNFKRHLKKLRLQTKILMDKNISCSFLTSLSAVKFSADSFTIRRTLLWSSTYVWYIIRHYRSSGNCQA